MKNHYDILICGGGLAGLSLARQIRREIPEASLVVIEKTRRPLPPGGFKVGESTVEGAAHYLSETLDLGEILDRDHIRKNGPRFFTGGGGIALEERPEIGSAGFPRMPSWQIDRGVLEGEVRKLLEDEGVDFLEGYIVREMHPAPSADAVNSVRLEDARTGRETTLTGRWLVDALGRRRKLQRLLGHERENRHRASAAWFHFDGALDVNDFLPRGRWHERDPDGIRYRSTNFFTGDGYWTWLLVLKDGFTSFGIVTDETIHPFKDYNTHERALAWLRTHEPLLAERLVQVRPREFRGLRDFSYSSAQVFSENGWACVGDAGIFMDPLYSPGIDFIGLSNCMTTAMIKKERAGELTPRAVEQFNRLYLSMSEGLLETFRGNYRAFGKTIVFKAKLYWDTLFYWSFFAPILIFRLCDEPARLLESPVFAEYLRLETTMQRFFRDWAERAADVQPSGYTPYPPRESVLVDLHLRLLEKNSPEQAFARMENHLEICREAARQLWERAMRDIAPERAEEIIAGGTPRPERIHIQAGLDADPELFESAERPRELRMRLEFSYYYGETDENAHRASRMLLENVGGAFKI